MTIQRPSLSPDTGPAGTAVDNGYDFDMVYVCAICPTKSTQPAALDEQDLLCDYFTTFDYDLSKPHHPHFERRRIFTGKIRADMANSTEVSGQLTQEQIDTLKKNCHALVSGIDTSYGYVPTLGVGIAFCVLFGLSLIGHVAQYIRKRQWTSLAFATGAMSTPHPFNHAYLAVFK